MSSAYRDNFNYPRLYSLNAMTQQKDYVTECRRCDTKLAKNDDARREEDGEVYYLCDGCIADDVRSGL